MRNPTDFKVSSVDTDGVTIIVALWDRVKRETIRVEASEYETFPVPGRGMARKKKVVAVDPRQDSFPLPEKDLGIDDSALFGPGQ